MTDTSELAKAAQHLADLLAKSLSTSVTITVAPKEPPAPFAEKGPKTAQPTGLRALDF